MRTAFLQAFNVMIKPRGPICNLDCAYCYFLSKEALYPNSTFHLANEVLKNFTRQYIEAQKANRVTFAWQGGEPTLMGLDFFRQAVAYQRQYARPGVQIENTLQTNGTLLDEDWCKFLHEYNFLVGISIDGPPGLHDVYRLDKGGGPTFDRVWAGLDLLKKHQVEFNVLVTVNAANQDHPLEVYRFLRDEVETRFIQLIAIVERNNEAGFREGDTVKERSVTPERYGRFLCTVFDEWVRHDVGRVYIQAFDASLGAWVGQPGGLCIFAPTCGAALVMEHNGDLYSCDHFVEPDHRLGNIEESDLIELVASAQQRAFGASKRDRLPLYCRKCEVRFACHGECPKNRFVKAPDGEAGLNYLCVGYKAFFKHIDPAMRFMANELAHRRPPANVMQWMRKKRCVTSDADA